MIPGLSAAAFTNPARRVEIYLRKLFIVFFSNRLAVVRIEITVNHLDHFQLVQIRQIQKAVKYDGNVFFHNFYFELIGNV